MMGGSGVVGSATSTLQARVNYIQGEKDAKPATAESILENFAIGAIGGRIGGPGLGQKVFLNSKGVTSKVIMGAFKGKGPTKVFPSKASMITLKSEFMKGNIDANNATNFITCLLADLKK